MTADGEEKLEAARSHVQSAEAVVILAGAGMGVDSGLPDFRGDEGFWNAYPPYRDLGVSFVEMASPDHFARDPAFGWGFYGHRLSLYRDAEPHDGFRRLRDFVKSRPRGGFVFTSNVDGHFQKAGFDGERLLECHGSIHHLQCLQDCGAGIWSAESVSIEVDPETMRAREPLPACRNCGAMTRPNILMFGDWGWDGTRTEAQEARYETWLRKLDRNIRLAILEFGAGTAVPTVRRQSELLAAAFPESMLIRVNPREPQVDGLGDRGIGIAKGANETIARLLG